MLRGHLPPPMLKRSQTEWIPVSTSKGMAMESHPLLLDLGKGVSTPLFGPSETAGDAAGSFRIRRGAHAHILEPRGPIWIDGRLVTSPTPIRHGALIGSGETWYRFLEREEIAPSDRPEPTLLATRRLDDAPLGPARAFQTIELPDGRPVTLGRDPRRVEVALDRPVVSRSHARLVRHGLEVVVTDLDSANGTFIDGERLRGEARIQVGRRIDIGPFAFRFDGAGLVAIAPGAGCEIIASGLSRSGRDAEGNEFALLDDVNLAIQPGEFVAILGPSGAGKSVLLKTLSGRERPDRGRVTLNGQDLFAHFESMKNDIAVVHQKDALHEALTLERALDYAAKLRLPPDTDPAERRRRIGAMLVELGLEDRRALPIRRLSGGQIKRASLALETLHRPGLIFLDEVTSGLDEPTDRELMRLFRRLADQGQTVVCVTHTLANVEESCHLIVFLAPGGRLAFVGSPAEAREHFGVERLGDVYELLTGAVPDAASGIPLKPEDWAVRFKASPHWGARVSTRGASEARAAAKGPAPKATPKAPAWALAQRLAVPARQYPVLLSRLAAIQQADPWARIMTVAQCLIIGFSLFILFRNIGKDPDVPARTEATIRLAFLATVSCLWFGVSGAAKEIVKERALFERERDAGLCPEAYYAAKLTLLATTAAAQAALLFGLIDALCRPPWDRGLVCGLLVALAVQGTAVGLWISAASSSEEVAAGLPPIALIPQVIFAGVIAQLSGPSLWLARVGVASYWGCEGLRRAIPDLASLGGADDSPRLETVWALLAVQGAVFVAAASWHLDADRLPRTLGKNQGGKVSLIRVSSSDLR